MSKAPRGPAGAGDAPPSSPVINDFKGVEWEVDMTGAEKESYPPVSKKAHIKRCTEFRRAASIPEVSH